MKRFFLIVALLALFVLPTLALAQDGTPPGNVAPVFTPPAFPDAWQAFVAALVAIFATAIASPITAPVVSLIKRIPLPFFQNLGGNEVNLLVAVVLSGIMWLAQTLGYGAQINTIYKLIFALLPFISGIGANYISNQAVYSYGKGKDMPVLGYSRPDKAVLTPPSSSDSAQAGITG